MIKLVLVRHGQSEWNLENRFTGWTDVELSPKGIQEAKEAGIALKNKGYHFDLAYSSVLKRAEDTLDFILKEMGEENIPIKRSWKLNERHYGALQGLNKDETRKKYGDEQVLLWRRSTDVRPPELDENDEEIIELIRDKKVIVLLNKTDLEPVVTEEQIKDKFREIYEGEEKHDDSLHVIRTSTKDNTGIDEFEKTIQDMFFAGRIAVNDEIYITNQRHKEALVEAYDSLKMVQKSLEDEMPEDFYSIDLMSAYAALGRIIGEEVGEDLVNEIFSKFCMGK